MPVCMCVFVCKYVYVCVLHAGKEQCCQVHYCKRRYVYNPKPNWDSKINVVQGAGHLVP